MKAWIQNGKKWKKTHLQTKILFIKYKKIRGKGKQMRSNRIKRTNEGITLIALVITIIVLLILAGISIATLFGDNGILTKAIGAKEATEIGQEQEFVDLATTSAIQNSITTRGNAKFTQEELESELDKLTGGDNTDVTTKGSNYLVTFKDSKREYEVEIPNWSSADLDWEQILEDAKDDDSIQGIGTDGEPVDMSLWQYTEIEGGVGLFGGTAESCSWSENGYLGECPDGNIIGCVPQYIKVNGEFQPVVRMESTFKGNTELVNLPEIPSTVTNIDSICHNCQNLKTATIYATIETIGSHAFAECPNLENIAIAKGVKIIDERAFLGCEKLSNINLPDTIEELGEQCFAYCTSLSDIYLPEGLKSMCESFLGCTSLTSIEIPSTLESVYSDSGNSDASGGLNHTKYIGCFEDCSNLKTIIFRDGIKDLENIKEILIDSNIENLKIPGSVETIPELYRLAHWGNLSSLKNIEIGDGVKTIGWGAFRGFENLENINIPRSVVKIETYAFSSEKLTSITIPSSVTYVDENAFYNCTNLTEIRLESESTLQVPSNKWGAENATIIKE